MTLIRSLRPSLLALVLGAAALTPSTARAALECATDADCGQGFECSTWWSGAGTGGTGGHATVCGDGLCDEAEMDGSCPADCVANTQCIPARCTTDADCADGYECPEVYPPGSGGAGGAPSCGDGICTTGEDETTCAADCLVEAYCQPVATECWSDADCPTGSVCDWSSSGSGGSGAIGGSGGFGAMAGSSGTSAGGGAGGLGGTSGSGGTGIGGTGGSGGTGVGGTAGSGGSVGGTGGGIGGTGGTGGGTAGAGGAIAPAGICVVDGGGTGGLGGTSGSGGSGAFSGAGGAGGASSGGTGGSGVGGTGSGGTAATSGSGGSGTGTGGSSAQQPASSEDSGSCAVRPGRASTFTAALAALALAFARLRRRR